MICSVAVPIVPQSPKTCHIIKKLNAVTQKQEKGLYVRFSHPSLFSSFICFFLLHYSMNSHHTFFLRQNKQNCLSILSSCTLQFAVHLLPSWILKTWFCGDRGIRSLTDWIVLSDRQCSVQVQISMVHNQKSSWDVETSVNCPKGL